MVSSRVPGSAGWRSGASAEPERVRRTLQKLQIGKLDAIFCCHAHYDHALDAPLIAKETGARLLGCESTFNVGRGWCVPKTQMHVAHNGETVTCGKFRLTFVESAHSPGDRFPGTIDEPLLPPRRAKAWKTGKVWSVVIEHEGRRVLMHGSANFEPGALRRALGDKKIDTVYLSIGALGAQCDTCVRAYWDEVVVNTGAQRVILVHWDDFFRSLDKELQPMRYALDSFPRNVARIRSLAKEHGVKVVLPILNEPTDPFADPPTRL